MSDLIIFLVLAGIALVFRWLTSQAKEQSEDQTSPPPNEQRSRSPIETDSSNEEERVRKFLEALGVPQGTTPPPPVKPRPVTPRRVTTPTPAQPARKVRRSLVQPLPPLVTTPPPAQASGLEAMAPFEAAPPPPLPAAEKAPVAGTPLVVRQRSSGGVVPLPANPLATLLRSRDSVRQAVILRELLGPPRGLQPLARADGF